MWLVLCDPGDHSARWACDELRLRGLTPLELLAPATLVSARRCAYRIGADGAHFEIDLPDGRTLKSAHIAGVLNRVTHVPELAGLARTAHADARYAAAELNALLLSWLAALAAVSINPPTARGLAGAWRTPAEWAVLAAGSGLTVPALPLAAIAVPRPARHTATHTVIVLGDHVFGDELAPDLADACLRLARRAGTALLGIDLHVDANGRCSFAGATSVPELRVGGAALIDALARQLRTMSATRS